MYRDITVAFLETATSGSIIRIQVRHLCLSLTNRVRRLGRPRGGWQVAPPCLGGDALRPVSLRIFRVPTALVYWKSADSSTAAWNCTMDCRSRVRMPMILFQHDGVPRGGVVFDTHLADYGIRCPNRQERPS